MRIDCCMLWLHIIATACSWFSTPVIEYYGVQINLLMQHTLNNHYFEFAFHATTSLPIHRHRNLCLALFLPIEIFVLCCRSVAHLKRSMRDSFALIFHENMTQLNYAWENHFVLFCQSVSCNTRKGISNKECDWQTHFTLCNATHVSLIPFHNYSMCSAYISARDASDDLVTATIKCTFDIVILKPIAKRKSVEANFLLLKP